MTQKKWGAALELLSRLAENAQSEGRTGRLSKVLILKALVLQEMGNTEQGVTTLGESLTLAEPEGYTRMYLDEGQPMQLLITQWLRSVKSSSLLDYGAYLLSQFDSETHVVHANQEKGSPASDTFTSANEALPEPLSPRELEVLEFLALGKTNQDIAQQLVVARGTIKAHAASIYRKLDVGNRTEAVARARQLGILL